RPGYWREIFNSDSQEYGGEDYGNLGGSETQDVAWHGKPYSLNLIIPPLGAIFLENGGSPKGGGGAQVFANMVTDLGAVWTDDKRCRFRLWAPLAQEVQLHILNPQHTTIAMDAKPAGYHQTILENIEAGTRYKYRLSPTKEFPDPVSRYQPEGVHGPSEVIDPRFDWHDKHWFGLPIENYVIYELHVGTFTPEGTFEAVIRHLDELAETGITAVEIMPVAQFPGSRNWGYDGVFPFAVQNSYGGPPGLKKLVDACHQRGLAAILDVVYNHLGPEGN